jgi:hypothetical protein
MHLTAPVYLRNVIVGEADRGAVCGDLVEGSHVREYKDFPQ